MIRYGASIEAHRRAHVAALHREMETLSGELRGQGSGRMTLSYSCPGIGRDVTAISESDCRCLLGDAVEHNRERDTREGHTTVGPHRGDLGMFLDERPLSSYGSEGECRLAALALRLAALRVMTQHHGEERAVVVLVDDVLGELDSAHREALLRVVTQANQVLLTATEVPVEMQRHTAMTYRLERGELSTV